MTSKFNEVKMFLRLRDRTIGIVPHYSVDKKLVSVGINHRGCEIPTNVKVGRNAAATVDSILAKWAEIHAQSA